MNNSFFTKATIIIVRAFGSWTSVFLHSLFFSLWFLLKWKLEVLLVIVSLEAIYIGIFILMAGNEESKAKERHYQEQHKKDMAVIKSDAEVDKRALKELKILRKHVEVIKKSKV